MNRSRTTTVPNRDLEMRTVSDRFIIPRPIACSIAFVALFLYGLFAFVLVPARSDAYIFYTEGDMVSRASLNGSNVSPGFVTNSAFGANGIAVTDQNIYYTNSIDNQGYIGRSGLDGAGNNKFFLFIGNPWGLAVGGGQLYWASLVGNALGRFDLVTSSMNQAFVTNASGPYGVAVDGTHVYWSNSTSGTIGRANLDGSGVNQSFISGIDDPRGLAVRGGKIYWASFGSKVVGRADVDGTNVNQPFITGMSSILGLAVDDAHVYWTNFLGKTIGRANLDGSSPNQAFITTTDSPSGIAVTGDLEPPSLTIDSGPSGPTNNAGPTFGFTAEAGSTITCSIDTGTPTFGPCSTASTHSPPEMIADGDYTFRVRAADPANNSIIRTRAFTVDTVAPETTIELGPPEVSDSPNTTFFYGSNDNTATFQCRLDGASFASCGSSQDYNGLADGIHTFEVRAHDAAGNSDSTPASRTFVVDTTPDVEPPPVKDTTPPIVKITGKPKAKVKTKSGSVKVKVSFTSEAGAVFKCRLDKAAFKSCSSPYSVKAKSGKGKGKKHTIQVTATDKAGNQGKAASVGFTVIRKR